ncbi:DUF6414 family protein [Streptomyces bobili]|uniref:DUF6414 family protein n=1 Tax=Streptomyces bobili TaxID=67280 RepID=UPI0037989381
MDHCKELTLIIRDFLYVDVDKVRSILAQIEGSIPEEERSSNRQVNSGGGLPGTSMYADASREVHISKSLADSLFPSLEESLESEGLIHDITDVACGGDYWTSGEVREKNPPGSLIRLTAQGSLFDARYVAASFSGLGSAALGFQGLDPSDAPTLPPAVRKRQNKNRIARSQEISTGQLEATIPDFNIGSENDSVDGEQLRSMVRIARGLFSPGLHLNLFPVSGEDCTVTVRLQEGRQYLDSEPEVLFARYGTGQQEWTLVGSIGHHATAQSDIEISKFADESGRVNRGSAAKFINSFLSFMGAMGFLDLPQHPGFSVIPLAVYRQIPIS